MKNYAKSTINSSSLINSLYVGGVGEQHALIPKPPTFMNDLQFEVQISIFKLQKLIVSKTIFLLRSPQIQYFRKYNTSELVNIIK